MKIAYVAGFFAPVLTKLRASAKTHLEDRSLVWIPQHSNGDLNLNRFKGDFFGVVERGASEILVCAFVLRGHEYVLESLQAIVHEAKSRRPGIKIRVEQFKNAYSAGPVISTIEAFRPTIRIAVPASLSGLDGWVAERHSARMVLHPRALGAVKKSQYEDVALVYAALDLLGNEYWQMRTAGVEESVECLERFKAKLLALGLELSASIATHRAGELGEEYYVAYPEGTNGKRMLEHHIRKGSSREPRFCLRIYFFWDSDARKVVVGWLPSHLDTRAT